jgi:hypothetical protein
MRRRAKQRLIRATLLTALGLGAFGPAACGSVGEPLSEVKGGWELGLRRTGAFGGGSWASVTVKPPYGIGPQHGLKFVRGRLSGTMAGHLTEIRIERDAMTGRIGGRPVQLEMHAQAGQIDVWGTWGGATLDLVATDEQIRATVPSAHGQCCFEYTLRRAPSPPELAAFTLYVGDGRGLPAWARLEIPTPLRGYYTTPELALLILALLSTPM